MSGFQFSLTLLLALLGFHLSDGVKPDPQSLMHSLFDIKFDVQSAEVDPNCPLHPITAPLPVHKLPDTITTALQKIESLMKATVNSTNLPGIVTGIVYRDQLLWSQGVGTTVRGKDTPPTIDTVFRIGSISKVFASLVVYQLYERGLLSSLDDPLDKYYKGFTIHSETHDTVTIRQMLSQMSGLPREAPCGPSKSDLKLCDVTTETITLRLSAMYLIRPPWTRPSYSNLAYSLLGRILVEEVFFKGTSYEDYVEKYILSPLQMKNTGFNLTEGVRKAMATGYSPDGHPANLVDLGWNAPCGQMYSTVEDLNKLSLFFNEAFNFSYFPSSDDPAKSAGAGVDLRTDFSQVLSAANRRMMSQPVFWNPDGLTQFGTPFEIRTEEHYSMRTKGGNVPGYSASFTFVPELQLGLNVLFSGAASEFAFVAQAYEALIPAFYEVLAKMTPQGPPAPPSPESYVGSYVYAGTQVTAVVSSYQNSLIVKVVGVSVYLSCRSDGDSATSTGVSACRLYIPPNLTPCMTSELLAFTGEWVYFTGLEFSSTGHLSAYRSLTIPGVLYGVNFTRDSML